MNPAGDILHSVFGSELGGHACVYGMIGIYFTRYNSGGGMSGGHFKLSPFLSMSLRECYPEANRKTTYGNTGLLRAIVPNVIKLSRIKPPYNYIDSIGRNPVMCFISIESDYNRRFVSISSTSVERFHINRKQAHTRAAKPRYGFHINRKRL